MKPDEFLSCVRRSEFSTRRLLKEEFCSPWWVKAAHVSRRDAEGRILMCRKRGAYPVDGMVKCSRCGRWAPADSQGTSCVDCLVELDTLQFIKRAKGWAREDWAEISRVYWRRPVLVKRWFFEGMPPPSPEVDCELSVLEDADSGDSPVNEADIFDGVLESDQVWGNASGFRDLLRGLRSRFVEVRKTKKGKKRVFKGKGAGCAKRLLPESESGLRREIAYFAAKGRLAPWTRRLSDPFDRDERPLPMPGEPGRLWL